MRKLSLKYQLVLPFVLLMFLVPAGIGWMLYDASAAAVNSLSRRLLLDLSMQVKHSTEQALDNAISTLHSFVPHADDAALSGRFSPDLDALEKRIWATAEVYAHPGSYIYFGGVDGRFIGLYRLNDYLSELYRRAPDSELRHVYGMRQYGDKRALIRTDHFDPRQRPWYLAASTQNQLVWSPVYNDFTSGKPTITLAKPLRDATRSLVGVAAVDVELHFLSDLLKNLSISQNGIAFLIDSQGFIVASSGAATIRQNGVISRLRLSETGNPLLQAAQTDIQELLRRSTAQASPLEASFDSHAGHLNVAAIPVGVPHGLDWTAVVVAPRADFLSSITSSFNKSLAIAGACMLASLLAGMAILNRLLRDIYKLNDAARRIGEGESLPPLGIDRQDELGQLARTFHEMEHNLRTDKLTAAFNREFLFNRFRLLDAPPHDKLTTRSTFALLFIDLDDFKSVNDRLGHDTGDAVLIEIAARLKAATRLTDAVVRYGGDEFVVMLIDMSSLEAITAAEDKIRAAVEAPIATDRGNVNIGVSIGWALYPDDGNSIEKLVRIADERMFDAKKTRKSDR